jgi:hypothetical protein
MWPAGSYSPPDPLKASVGCLNLDKFDSIIYFHEFFKVSVGCLNLDKFSKIIFHCTIEIIGGLKT